jgi:glycogen synthase
MNIAFVSYEYPPDIAKGGIATYVSQLSKLLANIGCKVTVFAGSHSRNEVSIEGKVKVVRVNCTDPNDFRNKVVEPFKTEHITNSFDIVESPEIHANGLRIKELYPHLPLIVKLHAPNYLVERFKKVDTPFSRKLRFLLGAIKQGRFDLGYWRRYNYEDDLDYKITIAADCITAPSEPMKNWAVKYWKIPKNKILVIPNAFIPSDSLQKLNNHKLSKRVVFLGRLNPLKGLVQITLAMKEFLKTKSDWQWRVIGDDGPSHLSELSMKAWMSIQLKDVLTQVEFIDGVNFELISNVLEDCDFAVQISLFESFSYVCVELLSAGIPVIGSKVGGMADIIVNGESGFLINPKNNRQILKYIYWLSNNPESWKRMKLNSKKRALQISMKDITGQYLNLTNNLLSSK